MIKSNLETRSESRGGTRNVASARGKGNNGLTLCTIKYGDSPLDLSIVTHSIQKNRVSCCWPINLSFQDTFDNGLQDIEVMPFGHAICLRIVRGDSDMLDTMLI